MKVSLKVTVNFRDDGDAPAFLIKMQNADGDWWLVDARRWSDKHGDGVVFHDRATADKAVHLLQQAEAIVYGRSARKFSVVPFKQGGI